MKAVHFGAGNIGRGFIALLLARSGFEVIFIDINQSIINNINNHREYEVIYADQEQRVEKVSGVRGIHGEQLDEVTEQIADADIVTTAIGVKALPYIAGTIAAGLRRRIRTNRRQLPIIACENTIGGSSQLQQYVYEELTEEEIATMNEVAVFPNAAVDRIVPVQQNALGLNVVVEPYCEWIVERASMTSDRMPNVQGLTFVDKLEPYIFRKLFTVNTGHCSAAYFGYLRGYHTIQQVIADDEIRERIERIMRETGEVLCRLYGFDREEHDIYIRKILVRFANPYLQDDVLRIGRSPIRKLAADDRLIKPALLAYDLGIKVPNLLQAVIAALQYDAASDEEAMELQQALRTKGITYVIEHYLGIDRQHPLHQDLVQLYEDKEETA